jgi:hypothetical protein
MKKILYAASLLILACQAEPQNELIGFVESGTTRCCKIVADNTSYIKLKCGPYLVERAANFVRLNAPCKE